MLKTPLEELADAVLKTIGTKETEYHGEQDLTVDGDELNALIRLAKSVGKVCAPSDTIQIERGVIELTFALLESIEYVSDTVEFCPQCGFGPENGHSVDCELVEVKRLLKLALQDHQSSNRNER